MDVQCVRSVPGFRSWIYVHVHVTERVRFVCGVDNYLRTLAVWECMLDEARHVCFSSVFMSFLCFDVDGRYVDSSVWPVDEKTWCVNVGSLECH